jgi:hypothetical protein
MSVLIKGFEMPKDGCKDCAMVNRGRIFDICPFLRQEVNGNVERGGKPNGCPLIDVPDTNVGDLISRQAAIERATEEHDFFKGARTPTDKARRDELLNVMCWLGELPSAQSETEWNNHTVACLLAELFGDTCACNFNGIDEWLPEKCEVIDACPNPVGVACWEQFLKHRAERRTDE